MKNAILILILVALAAVVGGCGAYESLIGHPLHVLRQQHEYNESHRSGTNN